MSKIFVDEIAGIVSADTVAIPGHVIQVVEGSSTTSNTASTTTYGDIGLSASITPSSTSSKIYVLINVPAQAFRNDGNGGHGGLRIVRNDGSDTTVITVDTALGGLIGGSSSHRFRGICSLSNLDSPSSTSELTYRVQAKVNSTSASDNMITQYESNESTITLMEIAG